MNDVVEINRRKVFLQHEVASLLPLIYRLTDEAQHEVKKIVNFIEAHSDKTSSAVHELEARLSDIVTRWQSKIEKLGAQPKGLWLADFDSGDGYFCWKFPETEICYWHGYQDGFTGRILIKEKSRAHSYENSNCSN
ncbi:MAG: DUF2203 domain-containing protein [Bdellovibrionaceae bacterium]|nr:DUF2203 domain-containing protein [Pseudobdellovibrionaceae bacterium]